jgi:uncharacterized membrane protein
MTESEARTLATARTRLLIALLAGVVAGFVCIITGVQKYTPLVVWDVIVFVYGLWVWLSVWPMNEADTKSHAVSENPGRALADTFLLFASVASIVAVVVLLVDASNSEGTKKVVSICLGLASIILSWAMVHTVYMLKYARLYYGQSEGGIEFNEKDSPRYQDFAYLAFTLGMTFQVSDTDLMTKELRKAALKHALLSYVFGTVIIATTINTLASLSK